MSGAYTDQNEKTVVISARSFILRAGLERILADSGFKVLGSGQDLGAAQPGLLILEKSASSAETGEAIAEAKALCSHTRVVVLGDSFELDEIWSGREAGADGFCMTSAAPAVLVRSLELVLLGEPAIPSSLLADLIGFARQAQTRPLSAAPSKPLPQGLKLSPRETAILRSIKKGDANKVIARQFDVAEATVKVHVKAILRKLGAANRTQAAIWANDHLQAEAPALDIGPEHNGRPLQ
jgi:two-component system nitrate/nitrite response regulator NarL